MERVSRVVLASAFVAAVACGNDREAPPPFEADVYAEADAELRELDFGDDELVADEFTEDELADPNLVLPEQNREGLAEEDLSELSDLEELEADDGVDDELEGDEGPVEEEGDLGTASIGAPSLLPASIDPASLAPLAVPTDRTWFAERYPCPNNAKKCVCRGSMHNCQFPNSQPGRNRYLPPEAIKAIRSVTGTETRKRLISALGKWGIEPGTALYDGRGVRRGVIQTLPYREGAVGSVTEESSSNRCFYLDGNVLRQKNVDFPCVRINAGQRKKIGGQEYVYAFAVRLDNGINASGWIPRSSIRSGAFKMKASKPIGGNDFASTEYVVKDVSDYPCEPWRDPPCLARFRYKVRPRSQLERGEDFDDYVLRPGSVINLLYQTPLLGGASTDTFLVEKNKLAFKRLKSRDSKHRTAVRVRLYHKGGTRPVGSAAFVFGSINGRFGWIAASAIKKGKVASASSTNPTPPGGETPANPDFDCKNNPTGFFCQTCKDKPDGFYCTEVAPNAGVFCKNGLPEKGLSCASAAQKCKGLSEEGTIVCE